MSSPDAFQPVIVQLPLPPGITSLEEFLVLMGKGVTIAISVACALAIAGWDYFILLSDEISLYRNSDKSIWTSPAFYAFVVLRYAGILAVVTAIFFSSAHSDHCQLAASISQAGGVLVVASAGIIFCYRVFAIWNGNMLVYSIVSFFYLLMIACWLATATQLKAITGPPTPVLSNCSMLPVPSWSPIGYASCVAFDSIVLILSLIKLRPSTQGHSRVTRQIYQDNIFYFLAVTATNIVVFAIQSLGSDYDLLKPNAIPYSTLMTYAMGSRVFLNLRLFHKRQQRQQDGIPLTNSSGIPSFGTAAGVQRPNPMGVVVGYSQYTATDKGSPYIPNSE